MKMLLSVVPIGLSCTVAENCEILLLSRVFNVVAEFLLELCNPGWAKEQNDGATRTSRSLIISLAVSIQYTSVTDGRI